MLMKDHKKTPNLTQIGVFQKKGLGQALHLLPNYYYSAEYNIS